MFGVLIRRLPFKKRNCHVERNAVLFRMESRQLAVLGTHLNNSAPSVSDSHEIGSFDALSNKAHGTWNTVVDAKNIKAA